MKIEDFEDELGELYDELGEFVVCSLPANFQGSARSVVTFESSGEITDAIGRKIPTKITPHTHITKVPGKAREALFRHGFMYLLILRSKKFRELLESEPHFISDYDDVGYDETLAGLIENTLLIRSNTKNLTPYLKHYPDWTIAAMAEIRKMFMEREKYAPDYLMMCFQFSELKTDDEINALVKKHFPNYVGAGAKDRRGKLMKRFKEIPI